VKTLLFALGVLTLVGCTGLKPVGPLAKETPIAQQGKALPAASTESVMKAPTRPTPPTALVTPSDVDADPLAAAGKLTNELDADSKPTPNAPVTAEVSRYKGGVKQP
jgi:hypothetical protein